MGMELAKEVQTKLGKGKVRPSQFWGTTETTGSMTGNDWDFLDPTFSVGGIFANLRLRLVDDNDQDVEEGQPGELLIQVRFFADAITPEVYALIFGRVL